MRNDLACNFFLKLQDANLRFEISDRDISHCSFLICLLDRMAYLLYVVSKSTKRVLAPLRLPCKVSLHVASSGLFFMHKPR